MGDNAVIHNAFVLSVGIHTLLHANDTGDWVKWLKLVGVDDADFKRGTAFNQASMAIDAAVDGHGIALARTALAAWDLLAGRLVRPFPQALEAPFALWIVCPAPAADPPKIATFRSWLLNEAADDTRRLAELRARDFRQCVGQSQSRQGT